MGAGTIDEEKPALGGLGAADGRKWALRGLAHLVVESKLSIVRL